MNNISHIRSSIIYYIINIVCSVFIFFFNDTATTEIYTLSLHDALPISAPMVAARRAPPERRAGGRAADSRRCRRGESARGARRTAKRTCRRAATAAPRRARSEEHTSELQSQSNLVCRLLLEKKKK